MVTAAVTGIASLSLEAWQMNDWCRCCLLSEGIVSVFETSSPIKRIDPVTGLWSAHHVRRGGGRPEKISIIVNNIIIRKRLLK